MCGEMNGERFRLEQAAQLIVRRVRSESLKRLNADARDFAAVMCGRQAVQISPSESVHIDLAALRQKLEPAGEVKANDYLLRFRTGEYELTVFQDARSIIRGTDDIATARSLYSKYIGN